MTWFANRIYANGSPDLCAKLRGESALAGHVFLLSGTIPSSWEAGSAEIQLPTDGLVCVKEIGPDSEEEEGARHWFGRDEWVSWTAVEGPSHRSILVEPDDATFERPPVGLLRFLGSLHDACRVPVTYYLCQMWGGDIEEEAAWVFAETDLLYRYRGPDETLARDANGQRLVKRDVLALALSHHGIHLPTPYFAPHTREFDWQHRRLGP